MLEEAIQQPAHRHQLEAADVQADDADERRGLGLLLQDEDPHIVQPQLGGQHRAGRPAPGNDHVGRESRSIGAGGRMRVRHGQGRYKPKHIQSNISHPDLGWRQAVPISHDRFA